MIDRDKLLETAIKAAVEAGNIISAHTHDIIPRAAKESLRDVVTELDVYVEKEIVKILKEFDSGFAILTEETGEISGAQKGCRWVVDPLDGTVNFINGIPFYGTSIAFIENNTLIVGVFYNSVLKELFYGCRGVGVYKNHKKVQVKDRPPEKSLFSIAFSGKSYDRSMRKNEFLCFGKINDNSMGCLRTGSAAANLAYLTEGRFGGCCGKANKIWDVAAGLLLAELAGAKVSFQHIGTNLVNYVAATPSNWDFLNKVAGKLFV
ncbi:MAG: hypothetical protein KAS75_03960 [Planctomycetes bacterium]|nr:hypothetical protein [Planctomycetota bacterium]